MKTCSKKMKRTPLTRAEQRALAGTTYTEVERWLVVFAFGTGIRTGELPSLRWRDVVVKGGAR